MPEAAAAQFADSVQPFLEEHCYSCHGERRQRAELNFETFASAEAFVEHHDMVERMRDMLRAGQMPPENRKRPDPEWVAEVSGWMGDELDRLAANTRPDPGRVTARRLNRAEYNNTIRDLLAVDFKPADDFPVDDSGYGFDTIANVLSLSPLLMGKYLAAAEAIADRAVVTDPEKSEDLPKSHTQLLKCGHRFEEHNAACPRKILTPLMYRAYRRPVTRAEVNEAIALFEMARAEGDSFEEAIRLPVQAILVSPHFLFRIEADPEKPGTFKHINDYELASRLSYFLWSSMPDDELLRLAQKNDLHKPEILEEQVLRMLMDEKSRALAENFGGQWLQFRTLARLDPDRGRFPEFRKGLREDMAEETIRFFDGIVRQDRSIIEFLDSDYTYVNERLAKHYGIDNIKGEEFQKVALNTPQRGGVLTQASVLTVTSYPHRTSPVLRGFWVLENILGTPPPPPPDDVPALRDDDIGKKVTLREQLEKHRSNATCASCHSLMDPLGFGLENFDPIGGWREKRGDFPIDSTGELPTGERFTGPAELKALLMTRKNDFVHSLAEKMVTYALGRGVQRYDAPVINRIVERVIADDYRFSALALGIVESLPFQMRRGEGGTG